MYGGDALGPAGELRNVESMVYVEQCSRGIVRGDWGVEKMPAKSGSLFALHTDMLSFIGIDRCMLVFGDTLFFLCIHLTS